MTDQELEQRVRAWYRAEIPPDLTAPTELRSRVVAIPQVTAGSRWSDPRRGLTLLAAAAILTTAIAGGALVAGSGTSVSVPPPPVPSASASSGTTAKVPLGLALVGLDGNVRQDLGLPLDAWAPDLGPDGSKVVFLTGSDEIGFCGGCTSARRPAAVAVGEKAGAFIYPDDDLDVATIDQPVWSPDGSRLAGQAVTSDGNRDISGADLCPAGPGGLLTADARRLTTDPAIDEFPAWTPDGDAIVYTNRGHEIGESDISKTSEIWRIPVDGGQPVRLTDDQESDTQPDVAADGRVAYWHAGRIWTMDADGASKRPIGREDAGFAPRWSPDGTMIAGLRFVESERALIDPSVGLPTDLPLLEVVVTNVETADITVVGPRVASFFNAVSWTPDGDALLVARFDTAR
jgi:hypothetical protein